MSTLIAYASKHGFTEKCAQKLSQKLEGKIDLFDLKSGKSIDLSSYDKVIIGSPVYAGRIQKEAKEFCIKNIEGLKSKKLGLFICGMLSGNALESELSSAYPQELQSKALVVECFGGGCSFGKMNFIEKSIVKMVAKTNKDYSNIREDKIDSFAQAIKSA